MQKAQRNRRPKPRMLAPCESNKKLKLFEQLKPWEDEIAYAATDGITVEIRDKRGDAVLFWRTDFRKIIRWWTKKQKVRK